MKDDQRVTLTKRLLREGLLRLLEKKDIGQIRVSELCAEAGINRATFYRHYQQPRDIVADIRYELFQSAKALGSEERALRDPEAWLEDLCRYFYDRRDILKILFRCRTEEEFVSFINEQCHLHLQQLRRQGYGGALDDRELKLTAYCIAGGIYYVLRQWLTEPIDKTPEQIARILYRLLAIQ